jgi:hypothetical protein
LQDYKLQKLQRTSIYAFRLFLSEQKERTQESSSHRKEVEWLNKYQKDGDLSSFLHMLRTNVMYIPVTGIFYVSINIIALSKGKCLHSLSFQIVQTNRIDID